MFQRVHKLNIFPHSMQYTVDGPNPAQFIPIKIYRIFYTSSQVIFSPICSSIQTVTDEVIVDSVVCAVVDRPLGRSLDFDRFPGCWEVKDSLLLMVGPHAVSLIYKRNCVG